MGKGRAKGIYDRLVYGRRRKDLKSLGMVDGEHVEGTREEGDMELKRLEEDVEKVIERRRIGQVDLEKGEKDMIAYESHCYNLYLHSQPHDLVEYLSHLRSKGIVPSVLCYATGMRSCYQLDRHYTLEEGYELLSWKVYRMLIQDYGESRGMDDTERHFMVASKTILAKLLCWSKKLRDGLLVLGFDMDLLERDGVPDKKEVEQMIMKMGFRHNVVTWLTLMDLLNKVGQSRFVPIVFDLMILQGNIGSQSDRWYTLLIEAYARMGEKNEVVNVIEMMIQNGLYPKEHTIAMAMRRLVMGQIKSDEMWIAEKVDYLTQLRDMPSLKFLLSGLRAAGRSGAFDTALRLFEQVRLRKGGKNPDEGSYYSVIIAASNYLDKRNRDQTHDVNAFLPTLTADEGNEGLKEFNDINNVIDKLWEEYLEEYGDEKVRDAFALVARERIQDAYIFMKSQSGRIDEAMALIEESIKAPSASWRKFKHSGPCISLLHAIERESPNSQKDMSQVYSEVYTLLKKQNMKLRLSGIAFAIGGLVKEGNFKQALHLLKENEGYLNDLAEKDRREIKDAERFLFGSRMKMLLDVCIVHAAPGSAIDFVKMWKHRFT